MQSQGDIENPFHHVIRLVTSERVEEVGRNAELRVAFHDGLPIPQPVECGDDGRRLGLLDVGFDGIVPLQRIVQAEHGDSRAQYVHGSAFRNIPQEIRNFPRNGPGTHQISLQLLEFRSLGQATMPKQIDHLFKSRILRQSMDVEALVAKNAAIAIYETNIGLGRNDPLESRLCNWHLSPLLSANDFTPGTAKRARSESSILQNSQSLWALHP